MASEDETPGSNCEYQSDSQSESSTLIYSQEPFETFQKRVIELCQHLFDTSSGEISIERLQGGGFNRITGVSVVKSNEEPPVSIQYILRVPRFEIVELDYDIAPLKLLRQESSIPVPETVKFDLTSSNALGRPFMLQKRIPGESLYKINADLTHDEKCAIATGLGRVVSELHSIRSTITGRLCWKSPEEQLMIQPFGDQEVVTLLPYEKGPATQSCFDMLRAILEPKIEKVAASNPDEVELLEEPHLLTMASEMNDLGVLDESSYCLCHLDLQPRNILAGSSKPTESLALTGVLDWDSAVFAPLIMSCDPPMWLWVNDSIEDKRVAGDEPSTAELRELKQLFEQAAGPIYSRFSYDDRYRLARQLIRFIIEGINTNEAYRAFFLLQSEWDELKESLDLPKLDLEDQSEPASTNEIAEDDSESYSPKEDAAWSQSGRIAEAEIERQ
ncbi:uncharacterized protein N7483_004553 [Penicillium malachiteum]|uniref:uncharacterized protein n=1 Tax=Penicillium malachiteum TaxID=1324776 RepID=UPI0025481C0D|nr:uncharacterized protein N7483_004553 [Penicillium malachiteum]KAJ5730045.1 hypothetical protein N7483_004553 [Penicillium malachiteum]